LILTAGHPMRMSMKQNWTLKTVEFDHFVVFQNV